jgi:C-terminal processing protease CtpA/Prc
MRRRMLERLLAIGLVCGLASGAHAQTSLPEQMPGRGQLEAALGFEAPPNGMQPGGWGGGPGGTIFVDETIVHGGSRSARLERTAMSPSTSSSITKALPMTFSGQTIELRGFLRTQEVSRFAGLWMREDADSGVAAFDNMWRRKLAGTTGWTEYTITLPLVPEARSLVFGALLEGTGTVWVDDLQLLVDGRPIWEAPRREISHTAIDEDHEFDGGSGIRVTSLSRAQVENLTMLGRVWGLLKYHHPVINSGERHWDYELFRVLPAVLAAPNLRVADEVMLSWIDKLGPVEACNSCGPVESADDLYMAPDIGWISDERLLGRSLSERLRSIARSHIPARQFYVALVPGVGNPRFAHELPYDAFKIPDPGFQLLALYRFWNIIEYWYPYRDVIGEDWTRVLGEFIPRLMLARERDAYEREMLALLARVHDGHIQLLQSPSEGVQPPTGSCQVPVIIRYIEAQPVVTAYSNERRDRGGFQLGDVILGVDDVPVGRLFRSWAPYYPASNESTRMAQMARALTRGVCGRFIARVLRAGTAVRVSAKRVRPDKVDVEAGAHDDLPCETFRLLTPQVGYLKLSSVSAAKVADYIKAAMGTKGLIIDVRNYPSDYVVYALGGHFVDKETKFVRITHADLSDPGAFFWTDPDTIQPLEPHYAGKVVVLVDEDSISQSEYTAMALRVSPRAIVLGSTTGGADGNVSPFSLPGGLKTQISGIGVFYPDRKPTQRVGIVPDVVVRPTVAGIRAGRDEVLDAAVDHILRE